MDDRNNTEVLDKREKGYPVRACDAYLNGSSEFPLFSIEGAVKGADCLVLLVDHQEFKGISLDALLKKMRGGLIIDARVIWL